MMTEGEQGRHQQPWRPKEFFLSDPRAAEIREACLRILRTVDVLLTDPEVTQNQDRQQELYARLEHYEGCLIELGITENMHEWRPSEEFERSPVMAAEFVAGQLFYFTGRRIVSESDAFPIIQEFSQEFSQVSSERIHVLSEGKYLPDRFQDFMVALGVVNLADCLLGTTDSEKKQP